MYADTARRYQARPNIEQCVPSTIALTDDGSTIIYTNVTAQDQVHGVTETALIAVDANTGHPVWEVMLPCFAYAINQARQVPLIWEKASSI